MKSKKISFKLSVLALASVFATGAQANGVVSPTAAGVGGMVTYAAEGVNAGILTLANIVYTMGVGRSFGGQDMTIIYSLPAGTTFAATPAVPVYSSVASGVLVGHPAHPTVNVKRGGVGTSEVVYSVTVGASGITAGSSFSLVAPTVAAGTHGMTGAGTFLDAKIKLLDQVETACVDNAGVATPGAATECLLPTRLATLANAADFYIVAASGVAGAGVGTDGTTALPLTITDVNATIPLAGFVVANGDTASTANAVVRVNNATPGVRNSTNTADYVLGATDLVTISITDPTGLFSGLAASGIGYDLNSDGVISAAEKFTVVGNTASKINFAGNDAGFFLGAAAGSGRSVLYPADGINQMGVSRVFGITGAVTPAQAASPVTGFTGAHPFTGNAAWWTWGSNGTILETAFMSNTIVGYNNRFAIMNYGANQASYSVVCKTETGKTAVPGIAASGILAPNTLTVIPAADVCTITGTSTVGGLANTATRAGVRFTINAPSTVVKGVYNSINSTTGSVDSIELVRPTLNAAQW